MKLTIERRWKKDGYTIGRFYVDGIYQFNSLEDTDRGLTSTMALSTIISKKKYGITAIPTGTYTIILSISQKFQSRAWAKKYKGFVPEVLDVKGFSGVRIHPGNKADDTLGCPLVGDNTVKGGLTNSTKRFYELMDKYLIPAWNRKEKIELTIY